MRRIVLLLVVAISFAIHAQDPNLQRGFAPGKVYDFLGLDSVSMMNGNLNVRIPLGQQYSVGPVLQYQFMLAYNSKVWEIEYAGIGQDPQLPQSWAIPETRSNAGFGWQLTLGTLLPPKVHSVQGPQQGWTYLAPDGSEHEFPTVGDGSLAYTEDGSYLRLRRLPDITGREGYHEIDFPDGIIRQFDGDHNLTEIRDRYGYKVKVTRTATQWTVTEEAPGGGTGRTHTILFESARNSDGQPYGQENFWMRPVDVNLAAFGASASPANYHLDYTDTKVEVGPCADALSDTEWYVPRLDSVRLPDQSTFSMTYLSTSVGRCTQATLNVLTVPTGGKIRWNLGEYELTNQACRTPGPGVLEEGWRKGHAGVRQRTLENADGTIVEKRTYTPDLPMRGGLVEQRCGGGTEMWLLEKPPDVFKNTVTVSVPTDPASERTVEKTTHYFSAYPAVVDGTMTGGALVSPALGIEYGLPLARGTFVGDTEETKRFLSSRVYACGGTTCSDTVVRSTYLKYAMEESIGVSYLPKAKNPRVEAQRTVFEDDSCGGECRYYTDNASSNWDGYGHYRQSVFTSNIPETPEKTTFRNYTPDATNWLLELYDDAWIKEGTGSTAVGARSRATFDPVTGAMISQRTYKATGADPSTFGQNPNDLLTAWCRDTVHGFVTSERYFGGDLAGIPSGDPCTATRGAGHYFINHQYTFSGATLATHTAKYDGTSHRIADETFDANTGRVSASRDSAGIETGFTYDTSGRLKAVKPTEQASTTYEYLPTSNPPSLIARRCSAGLEECPTGSLTETRYYYDDLGRMIEERRRMPSSGTQEQWSALWTTYGPLGRTETSSVPVTTSSGDSGTDTSADATSWKYDFLGRVSKETLPDDSETTFAYQGAREKTRTSRIWTGVDADPQMPGNQDTPVSVTEQYDGQGRLVAVVENSNLAATEGSERTEYEYRIGDQLSLVRMGENSDRRFTFDGRGLLMKEEHPESGTTSYTYDARSHVVTKTTPIAELEFLYDDAERLETVKKVGATTHLQEFDYEDPASNNGRLTGQTRYNALDAGVYRVADAFAYDSAGRVSSKITTITDPALSAATFTQNYVYTALGQPDVLKYPTCSGCAPWTGLSIAERNIDLSYENGFLTSIAGVTAPNTTSSNAISYSPWGQVHKVLHSSNVLDTIEPDVMGRPSQIKFTSANDCAIITAQSNDTSVAPGDTTSFTITTTAGTTLMWFRVSAEGSVPTGVTTATFVTPALTETTSYWCQVTSQTCSRNSRTFKATVCKPKIESPAQDFAADGAIVPENSTNFLQVVVGEGTWAFKWEQIGVVRNPDGSWSPSGTATTLSGSSDTFNWVAPPYSPSNVYGIFVTVSGSCGAAPRRLVKVFDVRQNVPCEKPLPRLIKDVNSGLSVILSVDDDQDGVKYFWFEGASGDTSKPLGTGASITVTPIGTTSYWVRMTRNCEFSSASEDSAEKQVQAPTVPPIQRIYAYDKNSTLYWGSQSANLFVVMDPEPVKDQHDYTYEWYRDDATGPTKLSGTDATIHVSTDSVDTFWVKVTGTHTVTGGKKTEVTISPKMYVSLYAACDLPPLRMSQTVTTIPAGSSPAVTFIADCDWPNAEFTWYEGQSGDTREPKNADAGKPYQLTVGSSTVRPYWVRVSLSCGFHRDSPTLTFTKSDCGPVLINQNIDSVDVAYDATATLSIEIPSFPASYTWYEEGGSAPADRNGPTLVLKNVRKSARYGVTVRNTSCDSSAAAKSFLATVRVASCPSITPPQWQTEIWTDQNTSAILSAQSAGALGYQWFAGEVGDESAPIGGATLATYTTPALTSDTEYWVRVSGSNGCLVDSPTITVKVCDPVHIKKDSQGNDFPLHLTQSVEPGQFVRFSVPMVGTNLRYQWFKGIAPDTTTPVGREVDRLETLPQQTGEYWVLVTSRCGASGDDLRSWASPPFVASVCPVILTPPTATKAVVMPNTSTTLSIDASGTRLRYKWYTGDPAVGPSVLIASGESNSISVTLSQTTTYWVEVSSENCARYSEPITVSVCELPTLSINGRDKVTKGEYQALSLVGVPADQNREIMWYQGERGDTSTPITSQTNIGVSPNQTTKYWARLTLTDTGCYADSSSFEVNVCIPKITAQPQPTMIAAGAAASMSVSVDLPNMSYQWFAGLAGDTSNPVAGQTTASLTANPTVSTNYWVRVTGCAPYAVDSAAALVTICEPPSIYRQPSGANVTANFSWGFSVGASGSSLTYQWYKGVSGDTSTLLAGKTSAELTVSITETTDYWVRVSGACGTPLDSVTVKISIPPTITTQPIGSGTVMPGTVRTMTVVASGTQLRYEWHKIVGGVETLITGATSPSYTTPGITVDTTYFCRVYSGNNFTDSAPVPITVCQPMGLGWSAVNTQVASGQYQVLSLTGVPAGEPVSYAWYRGNVGDVSTPLGSQAGLGVSPTVTTTYWVRVTKTDTGCWTDSTSVTINVCRPSITTQPPASTTIDKIANPSAFAHLTVAADITPVTYQWYIGSPGNTTSPIAGATASAYDASPSADTTYWARVTGNCGISANSTAATVIVCKAPQISAHPGNATSTPNASRTLTVTATGTELVYQWFAGVSGTTTTAIGTNAASVTVTPSVTTDYWVRVTGRCGVVNSNTAKISIAPAITTQPAGSGTVMPGAVRTMTIAASGTQLSYEWHKVVGGVDTLITGATSTSYTTPGITVDTTYFSRVYSGSAFTDSAPVVFSVCQPLALGWSVVNTQVASGQYQVLSLTGVPAGEPVAYAWYRGNVGDVSTPLGSQAGLAVSPTVTTTYWARVTETDTGCWTNSTAVTINVCVPNITTQPPASTTIDKIANPSAFGHLTVAANVTPVTYQWYVGSPGNTASPIAGATASAYDASPSADTTYWARVTGNCGVSANSTAATVIVCKAPQISAHPGNSTSTPNASRTLTVTASGTDLVYQWFAGVSGTTTTPIGTNAASVTVTPSVTTDYWVRVTGRCGVVNSNTAKISIAPAITTQPAGGPITSGTTRTLTVTASGTQLRYEWYRRSGGVGTIIAGATSAAYTTTPITADSTFYARVYSGNAFIDSADATLTVCLPRTIGMSGWTSVSGSTVSLVVSDPSPNGDETYEWYRGATGNTSTLLSTANAVAVAPLETTQYWLRTKRAGCNADSAAITVVVCIPKITTQPAGGMIASGTSKTLSVAATGTPALSYQWYVGASGNTSNPISGATAASYTTPNLTASTTYWVRIACPQQSCGQNSVNSTAATVSVCQPPVITQQPASRTLTSSDYATLSVTATGDGLQYQWYQGTAGVTTTPVGTNSRTFTVQPGTTKSYWVRVTGTCGTANSSVALLSVLPVITTQPAQPFLCGLGTSVTFSIVASGSPLSYQWYRGYPNQPPVAMGTTPTISIPIAQLPASVYCMVTSGSASIYSNIIELTTTSPPPTAYSITKGAAGTGRYWLLSNVHQDDRPLVQWKWYEGAVGNVAASTLLYDNGPELIYVTPASLPRSYWVRVLYPDTGCGTDVGITLP